MTMKGKGMNPGASFWGRGLHHTSDLLIRRGTAMGPLVPLLLLSPIFLGAAWFLRSDLLLAGICLLVAILIPLEYGRQFSRFAGNDPDRLQSEEYRYEIQRLQLIAAKELPFPVPVDALPLSGPISNPIQPQADFTKLASLGNGTLEPEK